MFRIFAVRPFNNRSHDGTLPRLQSFSGNSLNLRLIPHGQGLAARLQHHDSAAFVVVWFVRHAVRSLGCFGPEALFHKLRETSLRRVWPATMTPFLSTTNRLPPTELFQQFSHGFDGPGAQFARILSV
jgi:hypothetical protein